MFFSFEGMHRFHENYILTEKTMNTPPTGNKTPSMSISKKVPLTKAYSCSDASPSARSTDCGFITPRQFVELVSQNDNAQDLPILDCRSQMDFGSERIRSSHNINCRTKIMARKLTSKRLEDVEPNLSSSLNRSDMVILYDQSTDVHGEEKIRSLPINLVVQAAQKSNKRVQIIQGTLRALKFDRTSNSFRRIGRSENRVSTFNRMSHRHAARRITGRLSSSSGKPRYHR